MKHFYDVNADGVNFGKFTKEEWANAFAALLIKRGFGNVEVDIQCFIVSTEQEFRKHMKKWTN